MGTIRSKPDGGPKIYGDVCIRKQRRKRQKLLIIELLYEYAQNSTLHGLRYIVDRGLLLFEKIFWLLTFLMSVGMCFYLISNVYMKWKTSPVIVSFSEKVIPVGSVPFPSITICPQLKSKASIYSYTNDMKKYLKYKNKTSNKKNWDKFQHIDVVCKLDLELETVNSRNRNYTDSSLIKDLYEVAPSLQDTFLQCVWRGESFPCHEYFARVITAEGICYNFNSLAAHEILRLDNLQKEYKYTEANKSSQDWSLSTGYTGFTKGKTYPKRGQENNASPDLRVILQQSPADEDDLCNGLKSGYKIYVQHPADLPQSSLYYYAALHGQVSSLALKFNMLVTDESLRGYSSDIRQCYFPEDRQLKYFHIYTSSNCRLECQSNYTFNKCGCVWYHMPHYDSRNICISTEKTRCMLEAMENLSMAELDNRKKEINTRPCRCLPSCNSVQYDAEILKTDFKVKRYLENAQKISGEKNLELNLKNMSAIEVYFKEPRFISMRRSELFGITDFMANCGGLLGLFLGFSLISLVEIFYFITMRLFNILRRDLREEKANRAKENTTDKF